MVHRHTLEHQRKSLAEIRNIMNSMKTLAYMETRKLAAFLDAQHAVVHSIQQAATDLLHFHSDLLPQGEATTQVNLLIGTERGFCGDFNHRLVNALPTSPTTSALNTPVFVAIGHKLCALLSENGNQVNTINGATVVEEIAPVLNRVVETLTHLQETHGPLTVDCFYHNDGEEDENSHSGIIRQRLLPPFQHSTASRPTFTNPPLLYQAPEAVLVELTDHYVFAALHQIAYTSLMAENRQRVTHLERVIKHLNNQLAEITRLSNAIRQEEIIEEIEVILLNATNLDQFPDEYQQRRD